jgi:Trypsin
MFKMTKLILTAIVLLTVYNIIFAVGIQRYDRDFEENEYCGLDPTVYNGKCKKITSCMNLLVEKRNIEICSFGKNYLGDDTLVCCSREDYYKSLGTDRKGSLDMESCMKKYKGFRNFDSGELAAFVINGVDVGEMEFAHMAAIGWVRWSDFSISWNCAGSLITENFVVSAAHCMQYNNLPPNLVRLGDVDLNSNMDDDHIQQFAISNIIKHPEYDAETNQNDIALIKLLGQVL